jgi:hypothetical protein
MAQAGEVDGTTVDPEDGQLSVNGVVIDEDPFHGDDGYLWDVTSWDVYGLLASSMDVEFDEFSLGPTHNGYILDFVILAVTYPIPLHVDIKPSSWPNPLHLRDKGVLPVAVYGTEDFDATTIDPETVRLTRDGVGVAPLRWSWEDVNEDGYPDLSLKFKAQEVIQTLGLDALHDRDVIPLTLTGNLKAEFGGTPIEGQDIILILEK